MFANNICDMEEDIQNARYTLPIYIGKDLSLKLFAFSYAFLYLDIILLVVLKVESIFSLIVLITALPVRKNIQTFLKRQDKKDTFILAVKNFILINFIRVITLIVASIINL